MSKDLEKLKETFLSADLDDDERAENEERINEWEKDIIENEAFASWQAHDITKKLVAQLKATYKEIGLRLATDRLLTQEARVSLWAKQDACVLMLDLMDTDAKGAIERVQREIRSALNAT